MGLRVFLVLAFAMALAACGSWHSQQTREASKSTPPSWRLSLRIEGMGGAKTGAQGLVAQQGDALTVTRFDGGAAYVPQSWSLLGDVVEATMPGERPNAVLLIALTYAGICLKAPAFPAADGGATLSISPVSTAAIQMMGSTPPTLESYLQALAVVVSASPAPIETTTIGQDAETAIARATAAEAGPETVATEKASDPASIAKSNREVQAQTVSSAAEAVASPSPSTATAAVPAAAAVPAVAVADVENGADSVASQCQQLETLVQCLVNVAPLLPGLFSSGVLGTLQLAYPATGCPQQLNFTPAFIPNVTWLTENMSTCAAAFGAIAGSALEDQLQDLIPGNGYLPLLQLFNAAGDAIASFDPSSYSHVTADQFGQCPEGLQPQTSVTGTACVPTPSCQNPGSECALSSALTLQEFFAACWGSSGLSLPLRKTSSCAGQAADYCALQPCGSASGPPNVGGAD